MLAEIVGGLVSGSLALIADAGHMLTDFASLVLAWFAVRLGRRPATWKMTYGFDRFSVLAAFVNGLALFVIAAWIIYEALNRFREPVEILGGPMLWVAIGGLVVNVAAFWILTRGEAGNLNIRAAALHVAGDLLGPVAALAASLVIIFTGWMPIDPLLSVLVVLLILRSAWKVVRESGHILLEGTPEGLDLNAVSTAIAAEVVGVAAVTHLHAWSVTQERPMMTMEVDIKPGEDPRRVKQDIRGLLERTYGVSHVTIEAAHPAG